jgi:AcrR family transcriptional regulator
LRAPGIARRERLLASARKLLATNELDALSLADVAAAAQIPKGSAYHFYRDIMDLYIGLLELISQEMLAGQSESLPQGRFTCWQDVVAAFIRRGVAYFNAHPEARQLVIGPKTPPELKLRDRKSDMHLAKVLEQHVTARFALPDTPHLTTLFYRAILISDLIFCLSMLEHAAITPEMTEEAIRAANGYLGTHLPTAPSVIPPGSAGARTRRATAQRQ